MAGLNVEALKANSGWNKKWYREKQSKSRSNFMNEENNKARWQLLDKQGGTKPPERVKKDIFQRTETGQTWM